MLKALEFPFEIQVADISEDVQPGESPSALVTRLATEKAAFVSRSNPDSLVLAADTIVVLDGHILGKPENENDAERMLKRLEGRTHSVLTGIALIHGSSFRTASLVAETEVTFDSLTENEIIDYVRSASPLDKAGAYGIQDDRGALFIKKIDGDFYNVMGLPLNRLYRLLHEEFGDFIVSLD